MVLGVVDLDADRALEPLGVLGSQRLRLVREQGLDVLDEEFDRALAYLDGPFVERLVDER